MTQLSNVLITDNSTYYQNKLSVIKTSDNCVFSKADLRSINWELLPKSSHLQFILLFLFFLGLKAQLLLLQQPQQLQLQYQQLRKHLPKKPLRKWLSQLILTLITIKLLVQVPIHTLTSKFQWMAPQLKASVDNCKKSWKLWSQNLWLKWTKPLQRYVNVDKYWKVFSFSYIILKMFKLFQYWSQIHYSSTFIPDEKSWWIVISGTFSKMGWKWKIPTFKPLVIFVVFIKICKNKVGSCKVSFFCVWH